MVAKNEENREISRFCGVRRASHAYHNFVTPPLSEQAPSGLPFLVVAPTGVDPVTFRFSIFSIQGFMRTSDILANSIKSTILLRLASPS